MYSQRNRELHKAIHNDYLGGVIRCLDEGPKRERKKVLDQADGNGATPLSRAAYGGHNRIVAALLDRGAKIDELNYEGSSPLIVACDNNKCETVELLLARGANIDLKTRVRYQNGFTPLLVACRQGHVDVVRLLLEKGANINLGNYCTPLQCACRHEKVEVVEFLLDREARTNARSLLAACYGDSVAVVHCLLARGVSITSDSLEVARTKPGIKALLDAAAPPKKRNLSHWINRIHLHVVGPRGDHQGSARHRILNCQHLARHLVSFLPRPPPRTKQRRRHPDADDTESDEEDRFLVRFPPGPEAFFSAR